MKRCTKCGEEKPEGEFYRSKRMKDGYCIYCKKCESTRVREWHKGKRFRRALKFSVTIALKCGHRPCNATEDEIREAFTGFCHNPGCRVPESECNQNLNLDHCHETGEFRGWLCNKCNRSAGVLGESIERILGLAEYLKRSQCIKTYGGPSGE